MQVTDGWLDNVRRVPTCRYGKRPPGTRISLIVIHCIALPPLHFGGHYVDDLFLGRLRGDEHPYFKGICNLEVSTHLFINRYGLITQYVSFLDRAWHAGRSSYNGRKECNDYSVGIELEGCDYCAYTLEQYESLKLAVDALRRAYPDIGGNIAGHNEVAPERKTDPGPHFNWRLFRN